MKTLSPTKSSYRKLYRIKEQSVLGGVCAGLGVYLGHDPLLIRIVLFLSVVLLGGGLMLYIILWIIIPIAQKAEHIEQMSIR